MSQINYDLPLFAVDFYADWCAPCINIKPQIAALCMSKHIPLYYINVDDTEELNQAIEKLKLPPIKTIPYFALSKNGKCEGTPSYQIFVDRVL